MTFEWWLAYIPVCALFSLSPGSGTINTMSVAISHGFAQSLIAIAGLQLGLAIHILLVGIGFGTLFSESEAMFSIVKWLGAGYLFWLGIQHWRHAGVLSLDHNRSLAHSGLFRQAVFVNLTNPKTIIYLAALFPQFITSGQPLSSQYAILGWTTIFIDTTVMLGYAGLAGRIAMFLTTPRRVMVMNRVFGMLFMLVGVMLALAHR